MLYHNFLLNQHHISSTDAGEEQDKGQDKGQDSFPSGAAVVDCEWTDINMLKD